MSALWRAIALSYALLAVCQACSCFSNDDSPCAYTKSRILFVGKVVWMAKVDESTMKYTLEVTEVFRGVKPGRVDVLTPRTGSECGYGFVPGLEYLVDAGYHNGSFHAGLCSRTKPLAQARDDLRYLRHF